MRRSRILACGIDDCHTQYTVCRLAEIYYFHLNARIFIPRCVVAHSHGMYWVCIYLQSDFMQNVRPVTILANFMVWRINKGFTSYNRH